MGRRRDDAAVAADSRWLPQPCPFRRCARRLHLLRAVRHVRPHLSLRDVAAAAAHGPLLAARLARVLPPRVATTKRRDVGAARRARTCSPIASSGAAIGCAGSRTCSSCGAACWRWRSPFRSSSAGCTSAPCLATCHSTRSCVFGFPAFRFPHDSALAFVIFHGLVWASFLVIAGVMLAVRRRMREEGAAAVQRFARRLHAADPALRDQRHRADAHRELHVDEGLRLHFIAILHAITVIVTLLWLPFGKFFHIFQRPAQLGVGFYKDVGRAQEQAHCRRCGHAFSSRMHVEDLIEVERQLGYRYEIPGDRRRALPVDLPALPAGVPGHGPERLVAWPPRRRAAAGGGPPADARPRQPGPGPRPARDGRRRELLPVARRHPRRPQEYADAMETAPAEHRDAATRSRRHRRVRAAPGLRQGRPAGHRRRARQARQDALLLLRPAVRHPAQGQGQPGHRLRAVGRVPLQQGDALSEGRQALPAAGASRSPAARLRDATPRRPAASGRWPTTRPSAASRRRSSASRTTHGPDAFARALRRQPDHREDLPDGQVRPHVPAHANIDYNGRLCMVSAAAGNKKAFGIDRAANPWADILGAEVILVSGANIAECAPITTNYIWQAREHGAKVIVVDPRITPIARTCDLFLPVKPGRDTALFNGILHLMIETRLARSRLHRAATPSGFDAVAEHGARVDAAAHRRGDRHRREGDPTGRRVVGHGEDAASCCTPAASSTTATACRTCLGAINIVLASGRIGRPNCGYATITGQGNGQGGREHGQKCDQLPGGRDLANPEHRAYVAGRLGHGPGGAAAAGRRCLRDLPQDRPRRDQGAALPLLQPGGLAAGQQLRRAQALEKLEFYVAIDFFLNESGPLRRRRAAGLAARGGRGHRHAGRRPGHQDQQGGRLPGRCAAGLAHHPGHRPGARPRAGLHLRESARDLRRAARGLARAASPTTRASPTRRSSEQSASSGRAQRGARGVAMPGRRARRGCSSRGRGTRSPRAPGPFYFPDGKARFNVDPVRAAGRGRRRRVPDHPDHRPRRQPVPVRQPDAAHRSAGRPVSRAAARDAPAAGRAARHRRRRLGDGREPPRRRARCARRS